MFFGEKLAAASGDASADAAADINIRKHILMQKAQITKKSPPKYRRFLCYIIVQSKLKINVCKLSKMLK